MAHPVERSNWSLPLLNKGQAPLLRDHSDPLNNNASRRILGLRHLSFIAVQPASVVFLPSHGPENSDFPAWFAR